jgi:DNA-binding CsgD family transcriptional regulator
MIQEPSLVAWKGLEPLPFPLTPHEMRILALLAEGHSYHRIAGRFGVTVNTIRNYIRSIYGKLDVHNKTEAVSKAFRGRLIA